LAEHLTDEPEIEGSNPSSILMMKSEWFFLAKVDGTHHYEKNSHQNQLQQIST
jgi:hypothetical protein